MSATVRDHEIYVDTVLHDAAYGDEEEEETPEPETNDERDEETNK